jgi:hypothetical protein
LPLFGVFVLSVAMVSSLLEAIYDLVAFLCPSFFFVKRRNIQSEKLVKSHLFASAHQTQRGCFSVEKCGQNNGFSIFSVS